MCSCIFCSLLVLCVIRGSAAYITPTWSLLHMQTWGPQPQPAWELGSSNLCKQLSRWFLVLCKVWETLHWFFWCYMVLEHYYVCLFHRTFSKRSWLWFYKFNHSEICTKMCAVGFTVFENSLCPKNRNTLAFAEVMNSLERVCAGVCPLVMLV